MVWDYIILIVNRGSGRICVIKPPARATDFSTTQEPMVAGVAIGDQTDRAMELEAGNADLPYRSREDL
jgi:hypothetical protein